MQTLDQWYDHQCRTHPNLREHLPLLRKLASQCQAAAEIGNRDGGSTAALLAGCPGTVYSIDLRKPRWAALLESLGASSRCKLIEGDSRQVDLPEPVDLLFIDSEHRADVLYAELVRHASRVRRWIVLHDTEIFGHRGEKRPHTGPVPGLLPAVHRFLREHPKWFVAQHHRNQYGLTVLSYNPADRPSSPPLSFRTFKMACLCCTFNRPAQLAEAVESFLRQAYPASQRELVILDDARQYDPAACDHLPGVKLVATRHRFRTLGEKRNACAALASPDVDAYAVWDDDDIYLPWHLDLMAWVFEAGYQWSLPDEVWLDRRSHLERKKSGGLFHGAWGFTREAFLSVGGYPAMQSGQDQALAARFKRAGIQSASPSQVLSSEPLRLSACPMPQAPCSLPSYIYRWHTYPGARHISALGKDGYQSRGEETVEPIDCLKPGWSQAWESVQRR